MRIEWNNVTWYSKLIALALFVALPFIGFWYGTHYGETIASLVVNNTTSTAISVTGFPGSAYYENVGEWQTDQDAHGHFSIAYPIDFSIDENYASSLSTDWRMGAHDTNGVNALTITIPSAFDPQTNFADAKLTVGYSADAGALAHCLATDQGEALAGATTTINGVGFTAFHANDAGAGNYYETTSYRTIYEGKCYALEYTIHSSQIANYPSSYDLKPFDEGQVTALLDRIVSTFRFL